jgi:hypothetical protein
MESKRVPGNPTVPQTWDALDVHREQIGGRSQSWVY